MLQTTVESYPTQQHEASVSLTLFKALGDKINKWLDDRCTKTWGNASVAVAPGTQLQNNGSNSFTVTVDPPSGSLTVSYGWAEKEDWQAAFSATLSADVTFFTITAAGKWNLRDTALKATLSAAGIPPPIASLIVNETSGAIDDLAQFYVTLSLSGSPKLSGDITKEWLASSSTGTVSGSCKLQGVITLSLDLVASVGTDKAFLYGKLTGSASTGITFGLDLSLEKDGLWGTPSIVFPGVELSVEAALTVAVTVPYIGRAEKGEDFNKSWKVFDESTLYPTGDDKPKWHLVGTTDATSGGGSE